MNPILADPDLKVHMSLDEIIHLSGQSTSSQLQGRKSGKKKKRKPKTREEEQLVAPEHSVPLLSSPNGLDIYVSKQSPLLSAENRRRITQAFSNRVANSNLLQKTKEIIPAEYKLIKTDQGVERVLVPAANCFLKPPRKKLLQPRKLNKASNTADSDIPNEWLPDAPPPLVSAPIFQAVTPPNELKVEVTEPDIVIIDPPNHKKHFEVIDVESDSPVHLLDGEKLFVPAPPSVPRSCGRTLNDRFTKLIENFQS